MTVSRSSCTAALAALMLLLLFAQSPALAGPDPGGGIGPLAPAPTITGLSVHLPPAARLAVGLLAALGLVRLLRPRADDPPPRS